MTEAGFMTLNQAAHFLGYKSANPIKAAIREGTLPAYRRNGKGRLRVKMVDLESLMILSNPVVERPKPRRKRRILHAEL